MPLTQHKTKTKLKALVALVCTTAVFAPLCVHAQSGDLATKTGTQLGLSLSGYKYEEPGYMSLKATKIGLDYSGTYALGTQWPHPDKGWFVRGDLHYANGKADYQSPISGSLNGTADWYVEARGVLGRDFDMGTYTLAPFIGLGFRHLYSDLGYQRESNYSTLPIGLTHKMNLADRSQLLTTVEYMHFIRGVQKSKLPTQSVSLDQHSGYGLRLDVMKRFDHWAVGPTLTYWRIGASDVGGQPQVIEPANKTYEFGLRAAYSF